MQQQLVLLGVLFVGVIVIGVVQGYKPNAQADVCHFPRRYNYPCEVHSVRTADGYILSTVHIPHSNKKVRTRNRKRPVVLLMHGIIWSSDCFLINHPSNGLAYMLSDAGYDVWLGNARGNTYSKRHVSKSASSPSFWKFSWHEIGIYDLPATVNYILARTKQRSLHYVGHSQGTTAFMVWLSTHRQDSLKIKTSHLLAPVAFMDHMTVVLAGSLASVFGQPSPLINSISLKEVVSRPPVHESASQICAEISPVREICYDAIRTLAGQSNRINRTMVPDLVATYPAGSSLRQFIHYLQEYSSGHFRHYDYGREQNLQVYSRPSPPNYRIDLIRTHSRINFYYGNNDVIVSPIDVHRLARVMKNTVELHRVVEQNYNHLDFLLAVDAKEMLNDCIFAKMERYEGRPFKRNACCHLLGKCRRSG